ncbi:MAG: hypothetical protein HZY73_09545 [Micropruina sp.]|nr:MAG: hypothetical protein HZY73_09545 [Micropruina sp.]
MPVSADALVACLLEIERHVGRGGWDQSARLFALVPTGELLAAEPSLAGQLRLDPAQPDALSSIEQDDGELRTATGEDLLSGLATITWGPGVHGCAIVVERSFLSGDDAALPDDPAEAARLVAEHPARQDLRVIVGVTRDGARHGLGRHRASGELFSDPELVPALAAVLARTLE